MAETSNSYSAPPVLETPLLPIEMVAIDMDGTLLTSDRQITKRSILAIRQATENKVLIVLATARPPRSVTNYYKQLKLRTALVAYNGALVYDPPTSQVLLHQPIEGSLARAVALYARGIYPEVVLHAEQLNRLITDRLDPQYQTETTRLFQPDVVAPLDQWPDGPITKLMLLGEPERMDGVSKSIQHHFSDSIGGAGSELPLRLVRNDPDLLQVMNPKTSKAAAIALVARFYGIDASRVMAVGDGLNDFGMLRWSAWGVAVGNARQTLKDAAQAVVADNDHDGVAEAMEKFVLNR